MLLSSLLAAVAENSENSEEMEMTLGSARVLVAAGCMTVALIAGIFILKNESTKRYALNYSILDYVTFVLLRVYSLIFVYSFLL